MATAELSPASDLGNVDDNPKNFNLDLSDAYETSPEESSAVEPVAMPIPDMIDESALPPDFGSDADLDISDIEVGGLGFEGLDLGGDREDVQADEAVPLDLGGVDEVTAEPDLEIPDVEAVTLDLGGEKTEITPVAEELALSPEPKLDEGITLDLGKDIAVEADTEPAVETAAEPEIEFELEGDDNSPTVTG